jgi:hypothetical protein
LNGEINAPEIRLVGVDGEQLGIVSLTDALAKAEAADLDQVELGGFRFRNRVAQRNDAELLAVHAHQPNLGSVDFAVQSLLLLVKSYCGISITFKKKRPNY